MLSFYVAHKNTILTRRSRRTCRENGTAEVLERKDLYKAVCLHFNLNPALDGHLVLLALQLAASASGGEWLGGTRCPGVSFPAVMKLLAGAAPEVWEQVRGLGGLCTAAVCVCSFPKRANPPTARSTRPASPAQVVESFLRRRYAAIVTRSPRASEPIPGGIDAVLQAVRSRMALTQSAWVQVEGGPTGGAYLSPPPRALKSYERQDVGERITALESAEAVAERKYGELEE